VVSAISDSGGKEMNSDKNWSQHNVLYIIQYIKIKHSSQPQKRVMNFISNKLEYWQLHSSLHWTFGILLAIVNQAFEVSLLAKPAKRSKARDGTSIWEKNSKMEVAETKNLITAAVL